MFKSENDGTSIASANLISVTDGKSLTAVNVTNTSTLSPVPYKFEDGIKIIFLVPYTSLKSF
jgi:hypothetical protein